MIIRALKSAFKEYSGVWHPYDTIRHPQLTPAYKGIKHSGQHRRAGVIKPSNPVNAKVTAIKSYYQLQIGPTTHCIHKKEQKLHIIRTTPLLLLLKETVLNFVMWALLYPSKYRFTCLLTLSPLTSLTRSIPY